jgi:hypothetical protein
MWFGTVFSRSSIEIVQFDLLKVFEVYLWILRKLKNVNRVWK